MKIRIIATVALALAGCAASDEPGGDAAGDDAGVPPARTAFRLKIENVGAVYPYFKSGTFEAVDPGQFVEVRFTAGQGARLSFATMFTESNDFFYAPKGGGIALYDQDGRGIIRDVTDEIELWDAGTEADQEPGLGTNQAPRQPTADRGPPDPDRSVRRAADRYGNLPPVDAVLRVFVGAQDGGRFMLRIENVSTASTLRVSTGETKPVPLSAGMFVVHDGPDPLFTDGAADRNQGLEALAEDGNPNPLERSAAPRTGLVAPLSPGVWTVHRDPAPLFNPGQRDAGRGLESLAEDGDPAALVATLDPDRSGVFGDGPLAPGDAVEVVFEAEPGDRLSLATMFLESNDLFFAPGPDGLPLFADGAPIEADHSAALVLWDLGTEWNEEPGVGRDQPPRQPAPGVGPRTDDPIAPVHDGYPYPRVLRATVGLDRTEQ